MVSMPTLATPQLKASRLANPDHPRFVGLAQLRSVLAYEDVAKSPTRSDAVLDMIGLLLRDAPASSVVKAFCRVRSQCESVCYLAIFRLRRWLEKEIVVKTGEGSWQALSLAFPDFRRIEQAYRRQAWELEDESQDWQAVSVDFAWNYMAGDEASETAVQVA